MFLIQTIYFCAIIGTSLFPTFIRILWIIFLYLRNMCMCQYMRFHFFRYCWEDLEISNIIGATNVCANIGNFVIFTIIQSILGYGPLFEEHMYVPIEEILVDFRHCWGLLEISTVIQETRGCAITEDLLSSAILGNIIKSVSLCRQYVCVPF